MAYRGATYASTASKSSAWDDPPPRKTTPPSSSDWFGQDSGSRQDALTSSLSNLSISGPNASNNAHQKRTERFAAPLAGDYVHVSRQLGLDDNVHRDFDLKRKEVQERFYGEIKAQLDAVKNASPSDRMEAYEQAVTSFRKLREGVVSSGRNDEFTITVYIESVAAARIANNWDEMKRSLQPLVYEVYPAADPRYWGQWAKHARLLLLFFICFAVPQEQATALHGSSMDIWSVLQRLPRNIRASEEVRWAVRLLCAVRFTDYPRFSSMLESADPEDASVISFVLPRYRARTLAILHKAYYTFPTELVKRYLCFGNEEEARAFVKERYPASKFENGVATLRPMPVPKK